MRQDFIFASIFASTLFGLSILGQCSVPVQPAYAEELSTDYIRIARNEKGDAIQLDTAVTTFESTTTPATKVDLIGAIHIAEKSYYDELNKIFERYDSVLYELIAPEDANIPTKGGGELSAISMLQRGLKSALRLEFQLDGIDYRAANFVHADMSPAQFMKSMDDRGESLMKLLIQLMVTSHRQQSEDPSRSPELALLSTLLDPSRTATLKSLLAQQFEDSDAVISALNGDEGTTIIGERNKVALVVMERERAAGRTNLAIFYGAGHMKDFEKRLINDYKFKAVSTTWIKAWDLRN